MAGRCVVQQWLEDRISIALKTVHVHAGLVDDDGGHVGEEVSQS